MFERFNEAARQVIVLAQEEARALGHNYLGGEHVLLGLLHPEAGVSSASAGTAVVVAPALGIGVLIGWAIWG